MKAACQTAGRDIKFAPWAKWAGGVFAGLIIAGVSSANVFILQTKVDLATQQQQIRALQNQVDRLEGRIDRMSWGSSVTTPEVGG